MTRILKISKNVNQHFFPRQDDNSPKNRLNKMFPKKKGEPVRFWHFIFLVPTGRKKIVAEKTAEIIRLSGFMFFFLTFFCCRFIPKNLALFLRPVVSLTALSDEGRKKIGEPHWLIYGPVNIGASIRQRVANIPLFFFAMERAVKEKNFFFEILKWRPVVECYTLVIRSTLEHLNLC